MNLILETERLILREMLPSDAPSLFEMDSNPNVHQYLWNKPVTSIDEVYEYIELVRNQYLENNIGRFVVILKETNELIGWAGLKYNTEMVNNKVDFYDIGYRLNEKFWGKGYASEATVAWLDYGFKTMKIEIMKQLHIQKICLKPNFTKNRNANDRTISGRWRFLELV